MNELWMDHLRKKQIEPSTRFDLLGNRIALTASSDSGLNMDIAPRFDLAKLLVSGKLARAIRTTYPREYTENWHWKGWKSRHRYGPAWAESSSSTQSRETG